MIDQYGIFRPSKLALEVVRQARNNPPLPAALHDFLRRFETECGIACCGIDAFAFPLPFDERSEAEVMKSQVIPIAGHSRWGQDARLAQMVADEIARAEQSSAPAVVVHELGQVLSKADWLLFLRHLRQGLAAKAVQVGVS